MLSTTRVVRDEAAPAAAAEVSPKISSIVDSVEKLTLLEVSELVQALKVSLGGLVCLDKREGRRAHGNTNREPKNEKGLFAPSLPIATREWRS